ncbi:MAG: phosphatase PAP2 family protein [Ruminococcus sp.]|nr:phosphatase PAP2 family protein [Ruminococcus sp.]
MKMKNAKKILCIGAALLTAFTLWTFLIQIVDVRPVGQNGTNIGFAAINVWFFQLTGVHMAIYTVTDWLGLVPILICMIFGGIGLVQLIKRRSLFKVDPDILLLGIYYILVIVGYLVFEMVPINYRPIPIDGYMEASYPSSTTLLVLSVMPTLSLQVNRRIQNRLLRTAINIFSILFSLFMVIGRTIAGVHWLTDIIGSVLLSAGLFMIYMGFVLLFDGRSNALSEE